MSFVRKLYIADTHFGHASIIRNCDRPFGSVEEMDAEIIRRWNEAVRPDDIVYHLGDWGWSNDGDRFAFKRMFHSLHGKKVLVIGNHDVRKDGSLRPDLAELPWHQAPAQMLEIKDEGRRVVLCHYALAQWNARHHGALHLFGHSHGKFVGGPGSRDVGVDMPDVQFRPRTLAELMPGIVLPVIDADAA